MSLNESMPDKTGNSSGVHYTYEAYLKKQKDRAAQYSLHDKDSQRAQSRNEVETAASNNENHEDIIKVNAKIVLGELHMELTSETPCNCEKPHEIHVIVPHAVIKETIEKPDKEKITIETTYDSITIVDSPQHEPIEKYR